MESHALQGITRPIRPGRKNKTPLPTPAKAPAVAYGRLKSGLIEKWP